jgi:hypothetical protein
VLCGHTYFCNFLKGNARAKRGRREEEEEEGEGQGGQLLAMTQVRY